MTRSIVTFLSDYGWDDEFRAVCIGMMLRVDADTSVLDISHGISPGDIRSGALMLLRAITYLPPGVHLAIVDPSVGGDRRAVAAATGDGRIFVGPDNGLLAPAIAICGGTTAAVELDPQRWGIGNPCATFAGRDVFAPAAAALAAGETLAGVGFEIDAITLTPLMLPLCSSASGKISGVALWIDRFGNVSTNISETDLVAGGISSGDHAIVEVGPTKRRMPLVRTFASVDNGKALAFVDSGGQLAIAVNGGNAAEEFSVQVGDSVAIRVSPGIEQRT